MKTGLFLIGVISLAALILGGFTFLGSRPLDKATAMNKIDRLVSSSVGKKNVTQAIVYVDSPHYGVSQVFAYGELGGESLPEDQPFHGASIGKAFTATTIGLLIDNGEISLEDKIFEYLPADILKGLFIYQGTDYQDQVTVGQLLNHTSGIADYFEDKTDGFPGIHELVIENPENFWTPEDLITFSRDNQSPVAAPGEKFHYSDTGYVLLGMIIENITGQSFSSVLVEEIFEPLGMSDTYLMFYSEPANGLRPITDVHLGDDEIKDFQSLSIDWAGGGIVSTVHDLAIFIRALNNYEIIRQETLENLYTFDQKFMKGIHYGYGFMEYHFGEYLPTLKSLPHYIGHMGVLGTHMFYDKSTDSVYISSFGSTDFVARSVQTMIRVVSILERIE